jgi:carboxyl-terminal processing protease
VVTPIKLEKLAGGEGLHEADLPGALKNPDQPNSSAPPAAPKNGGAAAVTPRARPAPSVATREIGAADDEQLTEAVDILRGLAVFNPRASG